MWYSIEPKERKYVKGYGFLSFAKNMGKLFDTAKKSTTDAIKTASKKAIGTEATGDLIGYKIADKITNLLKKSLAEHSREVQDDKIEVPKERCISPEKRQQVINELRLV